jgi:hypothetical protein
MTNVTPFKKPEKTCRYGFTAAEAREKIEAARR